MTVDLMRFVMNVSDFETPVFFFQEVLHAREVGGWDRGETDRGSLLELCPGAIVEIVGHGEDFLPPSYEHDALAIGVSSPSEVEGFYARGCALGLQNSPPRVQGWGHLSSSARGPLGLEVVVFCDARQEASTGRHTCTKERDYVSGLHPPG
jgi:hypothetical protein